MITNIEQVASITTTSSDDIYIGRDRGFSVGRLTPRPSVDLGPDGVLRISGTNEDDTITIAPSGQNIKVTLNGDVTTLTDPVDSLVISTGPGDDTISISVSLPSNITTGDGNDTITASGGSKTIAAGEGKKTLLIGAG